MIAHPRPPKVDHVLRQRQTRDHTCHWPGCDRQVPPALWGCARHWNMLPKELQAAIWKAYRPGQEITGRASPAYVTAAVAARYWILANHPPQPKQGELL